MDDKKKARILLICTIVVIVVTITSIIFINTLDGPVSEDPVKVDREETQYPQQEITESRIDPQLIKSIVLSDDGSESEYTYRFELFVSEDQKEALFTCWYETEEGTVSCTSEPVNVSRLDDITKIIERYSVAETIKKYREAPGAATKLVDGGKELEMSWHDGDHVSLGYPNGAGKALEKYFIELAEWLHTKKY